MKFICINNDSATLLNTIVTIISIICTVLSGIFAYRAKKIKKSLSDRMAAFDLVSYSNELHSLYKKVSWSILTTISNKGGPNNSLLEELNSKLDDFIRYESNIPYVIRIGLNTNINYVSSNMWKIVEGTASPEEIDKWKSRLKEVVGKLMEITKNMKIG